MYRVQWTLGALNELTDLWINASDREAIEASLGGVEIRLSADPASAGESRGGSRRFLFAKPLVVYYEVDTTEGVVWGLSVRATRHP